MYKLVIIDDEAMIRKGLCEFINWTALGFEVVASFEDGREAIEYLKQNKVNIVFTDIKMSEISGLEVARYIFENHVEAKVVIISGYKEFEYAQKAIEYGVEYYILKPSDFEEIDRVFSRIREELDKEARLKEELKKDKEKYREVLPILYEQFFADLVLGGLKKQDEIEKRLRLLDLKINAKDSPCCLIDVKIRDCDLFVEKKQVYGKDMLHIVLCEYLRGEKDNVEYYSVPISNEGLKVVAISSVQKNLEEIRKTVEIFLNEAKNTISGFLQLNIEICNERCFENLVELAEYAQQIIPEKFMQEESKKIKVQPEEYVKLMKNYKLLISCINDKDNEKAENLIDEYFCEIRLLPVRIIQKLTINLFTMLCNRFSELNMNLWEAMNENMDYHDIVEMTKIEEIIKWSKGTVSSIIRMIIKSKEKSTSDVIDRVVKYMEDNFHKDISLEEVAETVFLNSAYFSRYFKQQTGVNFIDYLSRIRVDKAMELFGTGRYKAYEISEMVGYRNSKYFSKIFKQTTGYTPSEYCSRRLKEV